MSQRIIPEQRLLYGPTPLDTLFKFFPLVEATNIVYKVVYVSVSNPKTKGFDTTQ
jgi:hypothetical protein